MAKCYNKWSKVKKTKIDDIIFDSQEESLYYLELKKQKENKQILDFKMQVPFLLQEGFYWINKVDGKKKKIQDIEYICDFIINNLDGSETVIDVKSKMTVKEQTFLLKVKMLKMKYNDIDFRIAMREKGKWIYK